MNPDRLSRAALVMAGALLLACGRKDTSRTDTADAADPVDSAAEAPAPESAPASDRTSVPLAAEDIDRWQRGMTAELEAVHQAAAKLKSARTGEDTLSAMMAMQDMSTLAAGAAELRTQDLELTAARLKGAGGVIEDRAPRCRPRRGAAMSGRRGRPGDTRTH